MYKVSTCLHSIRDEGSTQGRRGDYSKHQEAQDGEYRAQGKGKDSAIQLAQITQPELQGIFNLKEIIGAETSKL